MSAGGAVGRRWGCWSGWWTIAVASAAFGGAPRSVEAAPTHHPERSFYELRYPTVSTDPRFPTDLWDLLDPDLATLPVEGGRLEVAGARGPLTEVPGGLRLPANTYFVAHHTMAVDGASTVNAYSIVVDLSLPKLGSWVPLYNTQVANLNLAEAYISPGGALGKGSYSASVLAADRWYRVVVSVDVRAGFQRFYVDGQRVLEVPSSGVGGSFSIGAAPSWPQKVLLFATNDATPPVDLRRAALFDRALSDGEVAALGDSTGDIAPVPPKRHRFQITVDYSLDDSGFFKNPAARRALEGAAALWSDVISSDFPSPAGVQDWVWHPGKSRNVRVPLPQQADDFVVYAFGQDFSGGTKATGSPGGSAHQDKTDPWGYRKYGRRYRPWLGRITIDTTPARPWFFDATPYDSDDVPVATHYDFIATAVHELGHSLGFVHSTIDARLLATSGHEFVGPIARRRNSYRSLPLTSSSHGHWSRDLFGHIVRPNVEVHAMAGSDRLAGYRTYPGVLDVAAMADIGFDVDFSGLVSDPFFGARRHPDRAAFLTRQVGSKLPLGLWHLTSYDLASSSALLGFPLKYRAATLDPQRGTVAKLVDLGGAVRVPKGSGFVMTYDLPPSLGGKSVNAYSLVFDVRIDRLGEKHALYNTDPHNGNGAEGLIDEQGRVGWFRFSARTVTPGQWHRIVATVDNQAKEQIFYLDGQLAVKVNTSGVDSSTSLGLLPAYDQWICLFNDGTGADADTDVRKVALFPEALTPAEVARLGDASGDIAL